MEFKKGYYYHIYNRGNLNQRIFYFRENYLFFLRKMNDYINPFVSFVAWCLMPNHFHWLVYVEHEKLKLTVSGTPTQSGSNTIAPQERTLNHSLGIALSSYTRAIQKQEGFSGSLFQKRTKAKTLVDEVEIEPAYWNTTFGTQINIAQGKSYLETCIEYIHFNPVYSKLTKHPEDWEFSSYKDFIGIRNGKLINKEILKKEGILHESYSGHPTSSRKPTNIKMNECIISIGSNIEAEPNIKKMLEIIGKDLSILKISKFIKTKPIGITDQPDFTNGAVKIQTTSTKKSLNKYLKKVEDQLGRDRSAKKFGPRTIDLDIVVWNGEVIDDDYYSRDFLKNAVDEVLH